MDEEVSEEMILHAKEMNTKSNQIADTIVKAIADVGGDPISAQDAAVLGVIAAAKVLVAIADRTDGGGVRDWIKFVGVLAFSSYVSGQPVTPSMLQGGAPKGTRLN